MAAFAGATGIPCRYLEGGAERPASACEGFCERLQRCPEALRRCLGYIEISGAQSEQIGEPYFSRCHAGMIEVACAVMHGRERVGTLLCGPLLLWDKDELAAEEMLDSLRGLDIDRHALFEDYFSLPVLTARRLSDVSDMLAVVAASLGAPDRDVVEERRTITRQQMKMADEIIDRKRAEESRRERAARVGVYPLNKERELLGRVRLGDRNGARRILNELLALIFYDTAGNMDVMKARILELVVVISRAAVEGGAQMSRLLGYDYNYLAELDRQNAFEDVCSWVVRMLDAFIDAVYSTRNVKSSRYLGGVMEYIHEHYAEPVSLEQAAARVPISPYYLSHIFRDELGMTFLEYVTRVRIEEAKELLVSTDMRIRDIAAQVGYDDAGYFAKVFRKTVGVTPNQYRKQ